MKGAAAVLGVLTAATGCRPTSSDHLYQGQVERFATAAAAQDSSALRRLAESDEVARWALEAARLRPAIFTGLRGAVHVKRARVAADTVVMVYHTLGACADRPIVVTFVGPASTSRVSRIETDCQSQGIAR